MNSEQNSFLPISHPQFRYPVSRNIYFSKLTQIQNLPSPKAFLDHHAESKKGQWRSLFNFEKMTPLHVEIGCNGGHVLLGQAKASPKTAFLGIDWKFKQIHIAAKKAQKTDLRNVLFVRGNAERLPFLFEQNEISRLSFLFPDPWSKTAHRKKRLLKAQWLDSVWPLLQNEGEFELRTDHRDYFDFVLKEIPKIKTPWEVVCKNFDLYKNHPNPRSLIIPEVTLFEKLFIKDGLPIHRLVLKKRSLLYRFND